MSEIRKRRKEVRLPQALHEKLMQRKEETRLDAGDQVHLALEQALQEHKQGRAVAGDIPLLHESDARLPLMVEEEFWGQVKGVARQQEKSLRGFVIAALTRYLSEGTSEIQNSDASMRRVAQEEIHAVLRSSRPMPPSNTGQLLANLGQWTRPQGAEYVMSGQVNAGPLRELPDSDIEELLSDFEILEWEDKRDIMLRITEDAKEGECLIFDDIFPGDILHFRHGLQPENGEIVVAVGYDTEGRTFGTVKHYYETATGIELRPNNPVCETIRAFTGDIQVRGVLFNLIQRNFRARLQMRRRMGVRVFPEYYKVAA